MVSLDMVSENKLPLDLRCATPTMSWLLGLTYRQRGLQSLDWNPSNKMLSMYCQWACLRVLLVSLFWVLWIFQPSDLRDRSALLKICCFLRHILRISLFIHCRLCSGDLVVVVATYLSMISLMEFLNLTYLTFTELFPLVSKTSRQGTEASPLTICQSASNHKYMIMGFVW